MPFLPHTFFWSLPKAALALASLASISSSMVTFLERVNLSTAFNVTASKIKGGSRYYSGDTQLPFSSRVLSVQYRDPPFILANVNSYNVHVRQHAARMPSSEIALITLRFLQSPSYGFLHNKYQPIFACFCVCLFDVLTACMRVSTYKISIEVSKNTMFFLYVQLLGCCSKTQVHRSHLSLRGL